VTKQKCLIVKLGSIGDVAMVLPAAFRLYQSGAEIDWLCGETVVPLLSCYSWIHVISVNEKRLFGRSKVKAVLELLKIWKKLFLVNCKTCATLQYDKRFQLLTIPIIARRKIGLSWTDRRFNLVSERHHSWEYTRILLSTEDGYSNEEIAPTAPDKLPENPIPREGKTRIALVPGGARNLIRDDPQRRWPMESYIELANLLLEKGHEVVLSGGPDDQWVSPYFSALAVKNQIGKLTIPETLAFYGSCDCVVTHDTGPLHLAGLTQSKIVALFGPTAPSKFLPRRKGVIGLWGGERLPCRPCYDGRGYAECKWNGCMVSIKPSYVLETIKAILAKPKEGWQVINM